MIGVLLMTNHWIQGDCQSVVNNQQVPYAKQIGMLPYNWLEVLFYWENLKKTRYSMVPD